MSTAHPGSIVFVTDDRPPCIRQVSEVPARVAFAGEEPVLRVESRVVGGRRVVRSYGAERKLLATTWQG